MFIALGVVGAIALFVCAGGIAAAAYFLTQDDDEPPSFAFPVDYEPAAPKAEAGGEYPIVEDLCTLVEPDLFESLLPLTETPTPELREVGSNPKAICTWSMSNQGEYMPFGLGWISATYRVSDDQEFISEQYDLLQSTHDTHDPLPTPEVGGDEVTAAEQTYDGPSTAKRTAYLLIRDGNLLMEIEVRLSSEGASGVMPTDELVSGLATDMANQILHGARS